MGKSKTARRSLRFGGQFERRCRCLLHDDNTDYDRLFKTSGKEFEKTKLNKLIEDKHISPKAKWICSNCLSINAKDSSSDENSSSLQVMSLLLILHPSMMNSISINCVMLG